MYLKSLVLKGFKSFADKSVLNLEPGITAVVGPNGSGKSNISDAVLWVLGERNAKNLRGQVMEDVIFAGSSKRRSVNVAEVSLVLDNSDGALPVEYNEVSITRRMYRTGESEYLINGSLARRMDILDILHDSGLGTGTHSIISQGHLDSILQSKPEDRRSLIEEAAGVLKHKQRKAKSQRKLEQMDQHLARVNDVVGEVARQLGPLERKARRALAYKDVSAQLAQLTLQLSVDDLRRFQTQYKSCEREEQSLSSQLETQKEQIVQAEQTVEALQAQFAQDSYDTMSAVKQAQRMGTCTQHLDANIALCEQRYEHAQSRIEEFLSQHSSQKQRAEELSLELQEHKTQLSELQTQSSEALKNQEQLSCEHLEQKALVKELLQSANEAESQRLSLSAKLEQQTKDLARERELLAAGSGKMSSLQARIEDLTLQGSALEKQVEDAVRVQEGLSSQVDEHKQQAAQCQEELATAMQTAQNARKAFDQSRENCQRLQAELFSMEELERMLASESGPAYSWMIEQKDDDGRTPLPLARLIRAPREWEALVERLLSADITSLVVHDAECVHRLSDVLAGTQNQGFITLMMRKDASRVLPEINSYISKFGGQALINMLEVEPKAYDLTLALLGDVVICQTRDEALSRHANTSEHLRFATQDGFVVFPCGKVFCGFEEQSQDDSALERARHYNEVEQALKIAVHKQDELQKSSLEGERKVQTIQQLSLQATQELAQAQGKLSSACADVANLKKKLANVQQELLDSQRKLDQEKQKQTASSSRVDALVASSQAMSQKLDEASSSLAQVREVLAPAQNKEQQLQTAFSDARLTAATLSEKVRRVEFMVNSVQQQYQDSIHAADESFVEANRYSLFLAYAYPVLECLRVIASKAHGKYAKLEDMVSHAQDASNLLSERQTQARLRARQAHARHDELTAKLSDVRVEKGRLELQVQSTVNQIVNECASSIESAVELPVLDNREEAEQAANKLRNRIAKMGTINPDAAAEYEKLKERYDYLNEQLQDLHAARLALAKIDRVIESRMKDDFASTFIAVNENFQRIFESLFPGGQANLSLSDPDNMDTTGVEVTAQPRGKRVMKMSLMSGGEKSLVALALLFAVYQIRSAPFYILDEVEAALDDTNLRRLTAYLEQERKTTQLIMITHQRRTMEMADVLFGVSMQSDGISKVISQKLDHALHYAQ